MLLCVNLFIEFIEHTTARQKIIACIETIRENGGVVGAAVTADLKKLGIVINDNA